MSTNNNYLSPRNTFISSSGMFFPSYINVDSRSSQPYYQNNDKNQFDRKQHPFINKQINNYTNSNTISQSVIVMPNHQSKTTFGKLDSMARQVNAQEDNLCQKPQKGMDPTLYNTDREMQSLNSNQYNKHFYGVTNKKLSTEPPISPEVRRRRQSVDFNINLRKIPSDNTNVFPKTYLEQNKKEPNDCESTNSGSTNDFPKNKNFDFLKKRKDNPTIDTPTITSVQSMKNLQQFQISSPFKKTQNIWPLSISPIDQKQPTTEPKLSEQSPIKQDIKPRTNDFHFQAIQFKKKRITQSPIEGPKVSPPLNLKQSSVRERRATKFTREITLDDFILKQKLGKGAFGDVFIAQQKHIGFVCVIKKMSKKRIKEAKVEQHIMRQIKIQSYFNHQHLTSIYGYFQDEENLYLILQLLPDGSLQQIKKKRKLPEKQTASIVKQVAEGLKYMHEESVIHRDLKPQNLFMNQGYVKIGDFGCSIYQDVKGLRNTIVGCLEYSSPQQLSKQGYSEKIDAWSMGILTYELLFGKSPFEKDIINIAKNKDSKAELSQISFPTNPVIREQTKEFIVGLLQSDPQARMDMDEVLHHQFLRFQGENRV